MPGRPRIAVFVFCTVIAVSALMGLTSDAYATFHQEPPGDPGGSGGLWTRVDEDCPEPPRQSTFCYQWGTELCSVRYCN